MFVTSPRSNLFGHLSQMRRRARIGPLDMSDNFHQEIVIKPGKVVCCMFSLAILGVGPSQNLENLAKYKRWLCALIQLTNESIASM